MLKLVLAAALLVTCTVFAAAWVHNLAHMHEPGAAEPHVWQLAVALVAGFAALALAGPPPRDRD